MKNIVDIIQTALSQTGLKGLLSNLFDLFTIADDSAAVCMCCCCPEGCC